MSKSLFAELVEEAEFYNLPALVKLLEGSTS